MGDYSVATKNRFQLSMLENSDDEDVDLYEILKQEEEAKQQKKKQAAEQSVAPKKNAKSRSDKNSKPKQEQHVKFQEKSDVNDANAANIKKSGGGNNNRSASARSDNKPPRMRQSEQKSKDFESPPQEQNNGSSSNFRGGRRGGSGFRGGRGGRGFGGGGRRFDRHSGSDKTGVKATEKKEGQGGHNWGDEIESQLDSTAQSNEAEEKPESEEPTTEAAGEENAATDDAVEQTVEEAEPEVREMTLDEWKAAQAGSRTRQQFNVRQAGEGEDQSQWSSTVALESRKRSESQSYDDQFEDEATADNKVGSTRSALDKLNIEIKFASEGGARGPPTRGRGGGRYNSGPRGDRRGRGGRGGFRGGFRNNRFSDRSSAPRVDNEMEFPSLGSK